jgi:hypothetical protein
VNTKANSGSFKKGDRRTGRRKGSTSLKTRIVQEALLMAGEAIGEPRQVKVTEIDDRGRKHTRYKNQETGIDGFVGYLRWVGLNHPAVFCAVVGKVIPRQVYVDTQNIIRGSSQDLQAMRDEIRRRGIDVHRMLGDLITNPVKQIDATPTHVSQIEPATATTTDGDEDLRQLSDQELEFYDTPASFS